MPKKQPLGRKHKAGTGNNKAAPATRIISKTKVATKVELPSAKNLARQVQRDLEKLQRRREIQEGLFDPVGCFAHELGVCDASAVWHEDPAWGCSSRPQPFAGVWCMNGMSVRAMASQRVACVEEEGGMEAMFVSREWWHGYFGSVHVRQRAAERRHIEHTACCIMLDFLAPPSACHMKF